MLWSTQMSEDIPISTPTSATRSLHNLIKKRSTMHRPILTLANTKSTTSIVDSDPEEIEENASTPTPNPPTPTSGKRKTRTYKTRKLATASSIADLDPQKIEENAPAPNPTSKNQPAVSAKRKTRSSYKANNKMQKLADIASNIVSVVDLDPEVENEDF